MNILIIFSLILIVLIVLIFRLLNTKLTDLKVWTALLFIFIFKRLKTTKKTYFMKSGDLVKIGSTFNVERRFKQLFTSNPDLELYGVINENIEKLLHKYFKDFQYKNEFYYFNPIKNKIDTIIKKYNL